MLDGSLTLIEWLAIGTVAAGSVVLWFSSNRRWLAFMLAGMLYFAGLHAVRLLSQQLWSVSSVEGYLIGVVCSLFLLATWLIMTEEQRMNRRQAEKIARQIEHRPVECREI